LPCAPTGPCQRIPAGLSMPPVLKLLASHWKARGEVVPIAAVDDHARADFVDLHTIAVELHLMQPAVAGGHFLGANGVAGRNKAERGHGLQDVVASLR